MEPRQPPAQTKHRTEIYQGPYQVRWCQRQRSVSVARGYHPLTRQNLFVRLSSQGLKEMTMTNTDHQRKAFPVAEILITIGLLHLAVYIIYATAEAGLL